ncbi:hypothetical protein [Isoptericola sp. G70]|uniref:hypothetical protein n=1 Tax=Isoptericola sp. G70 TaxID=3376633 RepID=UPI003A8119F6
MLLLLQALLGAFFVGAWLENLGDRSNGIGTIPVWLSTVTVTAFVGAILNELHAAVRRHENLPFVVFSSTVLIQIAWTIEAFYDS